MLSLKNCQKKESVTESRELTDFQTFTRVYTFVRIVHFLPRKKKFSPIFHHFDLFRLKQPLRVNKFNFYLFPDSRLFQGRPPIIFILMAPPKNKNKKIIMIQLNNNWNKRESRIRTTRENLPASPFPVRMHL